MDSSTKCLLVKAIILSMVASSLQIKCHNCAITNGIAKPPHCGIKGLDFVDCPETCLFASVTDGDQFALLQGCATESLTCEILKMFSSNRKNLSCSTCGWDGCNAEISTHLTAADSSRATDLPLGLAEDIAPLLVNRYPNSSPGMAAGAYTLLLSAAAAKASNFQ